MVSLTRTRAVTLRRSLPENGRDLGALDEDAIARVRDEAWPAPRSAEGWLMSVLPNATITDWPAALDTIDMLITDQAPTGDLAAALSEAHVEIRIARPASAAS